MMSDFVNLHCHSEFSLQDSVIKIENLVKKVKEFGQNSIAITDHASVAAFPYLESECVKNNIKSIYGNEFYCTQTHDNKTRERDHLVLLAMNDVGLANIFKLQKIGVENFYYRPIISYDEDLIKENIEGLYATSACSLGTISKCILNNNLKDAECYAETFNILFDGNFSLELQFHPDYDDQKIINEKLVSIAEDYAIPLTVSSDAHFVDESDRELRKAIQGIAWHKQFNELTDSLKSNCIANDDIVLQNAEESGFEDLSIVKKAIKQTSKIASLCNAKLPSNEKKVPKFDLNKKNELERLFEVVSW